MSIYFAIGHGCATSPLAYASSSLNEHVAYVGNAVLYLATLASALVLALPVVDYTGLRGGMVLGLGCYSVYATAFAIAALSSDLTVQWIFWVTGSLCGGLAAGILWTAQGAYMAISAVRISEADGETRENVNRDLSTQFAFYYLFFEVASKIVFTLVMLTGASAGVVGAVYAVFCIGSAAAMTLVQSISQKQQSEENSFHLRKLLGAVRLWSQLRTWLLSPTNVTFGIAAAYMNGYFNAHFGSKVAGQKYIGFLTALTVMTSVITTKCWGYLGSRFGNLVPICAGATSFGLIGFLMLVTSCCKDWGWWIVMFYMLQGSGRAVYENTNKAVFADTFKGEDAEGGFANCVLQMSIASAVLFFLSTSVSGNALEWLVLVFAVVTPLAFIAKEKLDRQSDPEAQPLTGDKNA